MKVRAWWLVILCAAVPAAGLAQPSGTPPPQPPMEEQPPGAQRSPAQQAPGLQQPPVAARPQRTIDNLNTAIQGEANASHRYMLFAAEADQEGYAQVAKLFRAAALAESIHQKNHEAVLRQLGIEPRTPVVEEVKVGTTRENLQIPIRGEANEQEEMYPQMVKQARAEHVPAAVKSFTYALDTEAEHLKLFKDALASLGHNRRVDYYVGKVSGDTTTQPTNREPYTRVQ